MKNNPGHKRRNYFINKEFQGRYIFNYFILATIGSILFIGVFSLFSFNTFSIVYDNYHLQLGVTPGILFKEILSTQWLFVIFGGIVVVIITLIFTHRVAGPFYRFEKTLDEMMEGDISHKIVLRQKDEGKELAQKINAFNFILGDKLSLIENFNSNIAVLSLQLKKQLEESDPDIQKSVTLINEILDSQKNIQTMINDYTFSREKL
ncbi:MAG: methyl-accepting chemotaxis protein [Proteobacteria bacterium]|nr:methyl-accepting chemotaxis protein [Pseudomonadota bacterium]MBU1388059.1 methyl-accepting chemotaxis protein [Pseudomonadota bacterium]MBU1542122.1 methyl-accepting chemotaxis protein [Pseudomonadota bacterium]MBU2482386.1 methyl-accepting chemotaxis protein [Pseudomonadota bacterium]